MLFSVAELPETSFTRSISNPEAVMRRRRAQKLEKKLQQFRSKDGGPDTGGTLKVPATWGGGFTWSNINLDLIAIISMVT